MKAFSIVALGFVVGLCAVTRVDAAAQFDRGNDRTRADQVCVYKDINYQGAEHCYSAGDQISDLNDQRKSISSIRVYGRATVTVYENTDFGGHSALFNSDVSDLGRRMMEGSNSWSDRIESLRIIGDSGFGNPNFNDRGNPGDYQRNQSARADQVCVYKDINYQGAEHCYGAGDEISDLNDQKKSISSIRVYGRATVTVYENTDFGGHSALFNSDVSDLGRRMMEGSNSWSDRIESLRIIGDSGFGNPNFNDRGNPGDYQRNQSARADQVCVYKDINYQGAEHCYGAGDEISDLNDQKKSISSIRVYGRATVTVYENTDFDGHSALFNSDVSDLGRRMMEGSNSWSDRIESLRIIGDSGFGFSDRGNSGDYRRNQPQQPRDGICVYDRPNYQGDSECWNQGENISDLARQGHWSGQISSIRLFGRVVAVFFQDTEYRGESLTVDRNIPDLATMRVKGNANGRNSGSWDHQISSVQVQEQRQYR